MQNAHSKGTKHAEINGVDIFSRRPCDKPFSIRPRIHLLVIKSGTVPGIGIECENERTRKEAEWH
jgi:hypothetical protein